MNNREPLAYRMPSDEEFADRIAEINQSIGEIHLLNAIMQKFGDGYGNIKISRKQWYEFSEPYLNKSKKVGNNDK